MSCFSKKIAELELGIWQESATTTNSFLKTIKPNVEKEALKIYTIAEIVRFEHSLKCIAMKRIRIFRKSYYSIGVENSDQIFW